SGSLSGRGRSRLLRRRRARRCGYAGQHFASFEGLKAWHSHKGDDILRPNSEEFIFSLIHQPLRILLLRYIASLIPVLIRRTHKRHVWRKDIGKRRPPGDIGRNGNRPEGVSMVCLPPSHKMLPARLPPFHIVLSRDLEPRLIRLASAPHEESPRQIP